MEFQNQPFQDLKERVAVVEEYCASLYKSVEELERKMALHRGPPAYGEAQSPEIRKEQDDAGGKPLFKTVEEIQKANEGGS